MSNCCHQEDRRDAVRGLNGWNGLDYVEVGSGQSTLFAYFLGKLPAELSVNQPGLEQYLEIEGGERIRGIRVTDVDPKVNPDPEIDDYLIIHLDKPGDFSTYRLRLKGIDKIDPLYASVPFSFKVDCPSPLDCAPACECEPQTWPSPPLNYLAKDYASFRQLILDRLALLMPAWTERHAADIGIALVEILAYAADSLSYYQDAVATEAYLDTARQRISVRRHTRLVDYILHEGCNARVWMHLKVDSPLKLDSAKVAFITGLNNALPIKQTILRWTDLNEVDPRTYDVFEPLQPGSGAEISLLPAHNEIHIYTWGNRECCLEQGSTSAALLDAWTGDESRLLQLHPGDVLIFEESKGPRTGVPGDADPSKRHAVRLTSIEPYEDPVVQTAEGRPTPYVRVEWAPQDALPFPLCISTIGQAPTCAYIDNISVARGNIILADHGRTELAEDLGSVPVASVDLSCDCAGRPSDVTPLPGKLRPVLRKPGITFSEPLPSKSPVSAAILMKQDPRSALPRVRLASEPQADWSPRYDLIASEGSDHHFVVEVDNDRLAHLRFDDGEHGMAPAAGTVFHAVYRTGNGTRGNVGSESISRLVLDNLSLDGVSVTVRNPLPATGGTDPEPIEEAKLFAPFAFRNTIERAIIDTDYTEIAQRNPDVQRASARLVWTGSWNEAVVAVDPLGGERTGRHLRHEVKHYLERFRRIGHDLSVREAQYVPIDLQLDACALPGYQKEHVHAALLDAFSNRKRKGGLLGYFHPDNLSFGDSLYVSRIVAFAQGIPGVECVQVIRLQRLFSPPNHEIDNGVLPLQLWEIAQLDRDPNFPERGRLEIIVNGGRS